MNERRFKATLGSAILSPEGDEIWAYWSHTAYYPSSTVNFRTMNSLLNLPTFDDSPTVDLRVKSVRLINQYTWMASQECCQKDFEDHNMFIVSLTSGAESLINSLKIIMNNPMFQRNFEETDVIERLDSFKTYAEEYYRKR